MCRGVGTFKWQAKTDIGNERSGRVHTAKIVETSDDCAVLRVLLLQQQVFIWMRREQVRIKKQRSPDRVGLIKSVCQKERLGIARLMDLDVVGLFRNLRANEGREGTEQINVELSRQSFFEPCHQVNAVGGKCYVINHNSENDKLVAFAEEVEFSVVSRGVEIPGGQASLQ